MKVAPVPALRLDGPLSLLADPLREGKPLPDAFVGFMRRAVASGDIEVLAARDQEDLPTGVCVLAFRPNISAGGIFASIEDLYVKPVARRRGVGRALLEAAGKRCEARGVSYIEVQTDDAAAETFYAACGYAPEPGVRVSSRTQAL